MLKCKDCGWQGLESNRRLEMDVVEQITERLRLFAGIREWSPDDYWYKRARESAKKLDEEIIQPAIEAAKQSLAKEK